MTLKHSNGKINWLTLWTAIGSLAAFVLAMPLLGEYAQAAFAPWREVPKDISDMKRDIQLIMIHDGITDSASTNHLFTSNRP